MNGRIYFVLAPNYFRIKIGYTSGDPVDRLRQLQSGSPESLQLLGSLSGSRVIEKWIHHHFDHLRQKGEWFDFNWELRYFMESFGAVIPDELDPNGLTRKPVCGVHDGR